MKWLQGNRLFVLILTGIVVSVLAGAAWIITSNHRIAATPAASPSPSATATPTPAAPLDPLQIEAIRARSYPGSVITQTGDLGEQGGYRNTEVSFQADGLTEYALQSTPDGAAPAGGWPVIILLHGYIDPAQYRTNGPEYRSFIAAFTGAGYMVVKPDYRGHGQSQGTPSGGHFSPDYAYDVLNLIASLRHYSGVNPTRLGLFAHSLGGHVALRTIVASTDIKATVFMAGVTGSFYDLLYNWPHSPMPSDRPLLVQTTKLQLLAKYGDPKANPGFWNSASAVNYVRNITGAVQINHDIGDSQVPLLFSQHLQSALEGAHKPVEAYYYPGDDHQFTANRTLLLQRALAFYASHL
jgi:dipeptidyl aminopeptidase/acylaminoacyl peptidase